MNRFDEEPLQIAEPTALMEGNLKTYRERGKTYKNGHEVHAQILQLLLPDGFSFNDPRKSTQFVLLNMCITKLVRYGMVLNDQHGHVDSAHDLSVYATMLESYTPGVEDVVY